MGGAQDIFAVAVVLGWLYAVALWFGFAGAAAFVARAKGRSGVGHFFLTLLVPPIGIFVVWALPPASIERMESQIRLITGSMADLQRKAGALVTPHGSG